MKVEQVKIGLTVPLSIYWTILSSTSAPADELWMKEFPVYPKATKVCSECLFSGPKQGITYTIYATADSPSTIKSFYQSKYHPADAAGDFRDSSGSKILSVDEVNGKNQPPCKNPPLQPPADAKSVIVVSLKIGDYKTDLTTSHSDSNQSPTQTQTPHIQEDKK